MADFPALPIWTDAFIADTTHLTAEEIGAYFMLLMVAWRSPGCALPNDDKLIMKYSRVSPYRWAQLRDTVMSFWTLEDGVWKQKKLSKVREQVGNISNQNRINGSKGGKAKALKYNDAVLANATNSPKRNSTNQNQNQIGSNEPSARARFETFWNEYPNRVKENAAWAEWQAVDGDSESEKIMSGLEAYRANKPEDRQWLNPDSFLRDRRWKDFEKQKPVEQVTVDAETAARFWKEKEKPYALRQLEKEFPQPWTLMVPKEWAEKHGQ